MTTLTFKTGNVNLRQESMKAHLFLCPRDGRPEALAGKAASLTTYPEIVKAGPVEWVPSIEGRDPNIIGRASRQQIAADDGTVFKLLVHKRATWGELPLTAHIYFRMRETAALMCIKCAMYSDAASHFPEAILEGRFDALTVEEVEELGIQVGQYMRFGREAVVQKAITEIIELEPEIAARIEHTREVITDEKGEEKVILVRKRKRSIQF